MLPLTYIIRGHLNFPAKLTNMADDASEAASEFKKYQAQMALKRQRKTEKNKVNKKKDRLLPARLTIQHLAAQVKGSLQKYARMGPLKRVYIQDKIKCYLTLELSPLLIEPYELNPCTETILLSRKYLFY